MRITNQSFRNLTPGQIVEVRPDLYDRDWTQAQVVKVLHTDLPLKNDRCTTLLRRYEVQVHVLNRTFYEPLILDECDVREFIDG